jgi:hypothetical protein
MIGIYGRERWHCESALVDVVEADHFYPGRHAYTSVGETAQDADSNRVSDAEDPVETLAACHQRTRHFTARLHRELFDIYDQRGIENNSGSFERLAVPRES